MKIKRDSFSYRFFKHVAEREPTDSCDYRWTLIKYGFFILLTTGIFIPLLPFLIAAMVISGNYILHQHGINGINPNGFPEPARVMELLNYSLSTFDHFLEALSGFMVIALLSASFFGFIYALTIFPAILNRVTFGLFYKLKNKYCKPVEIQ